MGWCFFITCYWLVMDRCCHEAHPVKKLFNILSFSPHKPPGVAESSSVTKTSGENREEQFKTLMIIGAPEVQRSSMTIINPPKSTTVSPVVHASVFSIVPAAAPTTLSPGLTDNTPAAPGLENVVSPKNVVSVPVTGPNSPRMDTVPAPGLAAPIGEKTVVIDEEPKECQVRKCFFWC